MESFIEKLQTLLSLMGFKAPRISFDEEHRKLLILIDDPLLQPHAASFLSSLDHLVNAMLKKNGLPTLVVDVNYYRKERERIIVDLARAAAHKARITKQEVELPPMNAYERRLVHMEISVSPELKTESVGFGKERRVVIKYLS